MKKRILSMLLAICFVFADIGKAVHMKTLNGYNGFMRPDAPHIT